MGLHYVNDQQQGFIRKRRGKGFEYFDQKGEKICDELILKRIDDLKVPPNWQRVWICCDESGHLQATGFDNRKRKQYLYHEEWMQYRKLHKFHRMVEFAGVLPRIRKRAHADVELPDWPREKVLGLVVLTLDDSYIRIGNREYMDENETFGLTTLRRRHLHFHDQQQESVRLEFKAKSGKYRKVNIRNNQLVGLIRECAELPGYEIFRYKDKSRYVPVQSADVNEYLRNITGEHFTAKDFRTWGGTVLAIEKFPEAEEKVRENKRLKLTTTLVKLVSQTLGNTQAICKEYYIHPAVYDIIDSGNNQKLYVQHRRPTRYSLDAVERRVLELIREYELNHPVSKDPLFATK